MSKYALRLITFLCIFLQYSPQLDSNQSHSVQLPVDVSYLAIDLKYHPVRGAQICEIQHGFPSMLGGDTFTNGGDSIVAQNLVSELSRYYDNSWVDIESISDPSLKRNFSINNKWIDIDGFRNLPNDPRFLQAAAQPVDDPTDLACYHGFVFMNPKVTDNRAKFQKDYPGVLFIDNAVYELRRDKFKMTELLMGNPITESHKPKWGHYSTKRDDTLAEKIISDIGSDILVIKPLDAWKGRGIIILKKEDLKETLEYIFKKRQPYVGMDDELNYWLTCNAKTFIVEEFIEVEPSELHFSDGKLYSPTIRLAFLLSYNKQEVEVICLGGYTYYPRKSISDPGTLTERYKTACGPPFYSKCDPVAFKASSEQMIEVLTIIYKKQLGLED